MSLLALMEEIRTERLATAAPATVATLRPSFPPNVAGLAGVAVATPRGVKIPIYPTVATVADVAVAKALPSISDFEERAALWEHEGGLHRETAERGAAVALGFQTPAAFYKAVLSGWRAAIEAVAPCEKYLALLKVSSLDFLRGPLALTAVRSGWCELALFGVFDGPLDAARARLGARGLIPTVAWSSLGLTIESIGREHAVLRTPSGVGQQRVHQSEIELAAAWWKCAPSHWGQNPSHCGQTIRSPG